MTFSKPAGNVEQTEQATLHGFCLHGTLKRVDEVFQDGLLKRGVVQLEDGAVWEGEVDVYGKFLHGRYTHVNGFVENIHNGWTIRYADKFGGLDGKDVIQGSVTLHEDRKIIKTGKFCITGELFEGVKQDHGRTYSGIFYKDRLTKGTFMRDSFLHEDGNFSDLDNGNWGLVQGKKYYPSGAVAEGTFYQYGLEKGKITETSGTVLDGKFSHSFDNNEITTLFVGTKTLVDGRKYEGTFYPTTSKYDLLRLEDGDFFDVDGVVYSGKFNKAGVLKNGVVKYQNGEIDKVQNGLTIIRADESYPDGRIKKGVAKNADGCLCDGEFDTEGNLIEGLETDTEGIVTKVGLKHTHLFGEISGGTIKHKTKVYPSGALAEGIVEVISAQNQPITYSGTFYENGNLKNGTKKFYRREDKGSFYPNGKIHKGSITETGGTIYEGEWDENGTFLNGSITDDEKPPKTRQIIGGAEIMSADEFYPDGSLKKGSIKFLNGNVYEGDFNAKRELVHGTIKLKDKPLFNLERRENDKLIGKNEFSEGVFDQQLRLLEGKRFAHKSPVEEGLFDKHEQLTKGKMTLLDGTVIKGDFSSTEKIIKGSITKTDNTVIEGDFDKNGNIQSGTITKPDGTAYRGDFYPAGSIRKGTVTKTDKMVIEGDFDQEGVLTNGTVTKPDGGIIEFIDGIEKILPKESAYQGIKKSVKSKITRIVNEW